MSHKSEAPSGMLNAFLYDERTTFERIAKVSFQSSPSESMLTSYQQGPDAQTLSRVKQLDREMRALTDARILKKARIKQKGE